MKKIYLFSILLLVWIIITDSKYYLFGVILILFLMKYNLQFLRIVNIKKILELIVFFLKYSLLGAIEVAKIALNPYNSPHSKYINYQFIHPNNTTKIVFCWLVTLTPGTLATELSDDYVVIHILSSKNENTNFLNILENKIYHALR